MRSAIALAAALFVFSSALSSAQSASTTRSSVNPMQVSVPRVIRLSGTVNNAVGQARTVGATLAIYKDEQGGAALWQEVQNVTLDASGHYFVLLGSSSSEGLPLELFASGEARWLEVQVQGESEQARVLLVSVPYALKAADAEMLGGKPASAFATNEPGVSGFSSASVQRSSVNGVTAASTVTTSGGNPNSLAKFDASGTNLVSSAVNESNGNLGIGTTSPNAKLSFGNFFGGAAAHFYDGGPGLRYGTGINGGEMQSFVPVGAHFSFNTGGDQQASGTNELLRLTSAGNLGFGTTAPNAKISFGTLFNAAAIHLYDGGAGSRYGIGINPAELQMFVPGGTHFSFNSGGDQQPGGINEMMRIGANGNVGIGTTAPGQKLSVAGAIESTAGGFKFPDGSVQSVAATGTITGVSAGTGLTGGGTSGVVTVAVDNTVVRANDSRLTDARAPLSGSSFYIQNGMGQQAANMNVTGSITAGAGISASAFTGNGAGLTNVSAVNSTQLGGVAAANFARTDQGNGLTGNQSINNGVVSIRTNNFEQLNLDGSGDLVALGALYVGTGNFNTATGGNLLVGQTTTGAAIANQFRVDSTGKGFFNGGTQASGADFAESFAVRGKREGYEPGDVLVIDASGQRRLALSQDAYSTLVAGIFSTKPALLGTPHNIDDPATAVEVPLAVVGVVPCKVTTENGPIHVGDLLVSSSTPGHAMRGSDRPKMLGAVVGKALEPLRIGEGVIQVLVTLQ